MRLLTVRHSAALVAATSLLVFLGHTGCDGVSSIASSSCSSCQMAFTDADCKKWGDLAGCMESKVSSTNTCMAGVAGCEFTDCSGPPICDDTGAADCAGAKSLTQADCDDIAKPAGCTSAMTGDFQANGMTVTGCHFLGCKFSPSCP